MGVVESGGSIKGAFGAGVRLALEKRKILRKCTYFNGTSVGALNSAAMSRLSAKELVALYKSLRKRSDVFSFAAYRFKGLFSLKPIMKKTQEALMGKLPKNVECVACTVDLKDATHPIEYWSNKEVKDFHKYLAMVGGSAAIPYFMESPTEPYFDGGIKEFIPIEETLRNCEKVIAISNSPVNPCEGDLKKPWYVPKILWWLYVTIDKAMQQEVKKGDFMKYLDDERVVVIQPKEKFNVGTFEINPEKIKYMIDAGYEAGMEADI